MEAVYDGYISRYVNRRFSDPMARVLTKTKITPNQVSWAAFGIAFLSFISEEVVAHGQDDRSDEEPGPPPSRRPGW